MCNIIICWSKMCNIIIFCTICVTSSFVGLKCVTPSFVCMKCATSHLLVQNRWHKHLFVWNVQHHHLFVQMCNMTICLSKMCNTIINSDLEISWNRHLPCITTIIGIYGETVDLHWKSSHFSLALHSEALVIRSRRVLFFKPCIYWFKMCDNIFFGPKSVKTSFLG